MFGYILAGIAVLLMAGLLYEQAARHRERTLPLPGRLIDVGGYRLHVTDSGQGSGPTVVVLHGAGDCSCSWFPVRKAVARFARVVTYDRPGLGASDSGPAPDPSRTLDELQTLLERAGVPGPYVLVGHSLGGIFARLYAIRHPEQVAGMVMVDSSHEELLHDKQFRQGFAALGIALKLFKFLSPVGLPRFLGEALGVVPQYPELKYYRPQLSSDEYRQFAAVAYRNLTRDGGFLEFGATWAILEEAARLWQRGGAEPQFGDLPMAVLTNPGFGEDWIAKHRELAARSSGSFHLISDRAGHSIQMARPELVVEAIQRVLAQVAERSNPVR
jgi:pimeloyl-ACP methyl ester carboxylesterase